MREHQILACLAILLLALASPALADERDDKIKALEQQLKEQNERLNRLEQLLKEQAAPKETPPAQRATPTTTAPATTTVAPAVQQSTASVNAGDPIASPPRPIPAYLSIGPNGFIMQTPDTNFWLRVGGLLQIDSRSYFADGGIEDNDMFLVRRARINLDGAVFRDFIFRIQPEFGGSSTSLRDAYVNYRAIDEAQLQVGKFKVPIGLEQLQSDSATMFVERSVVSDIAPSRDVGVQFHGEAWEGFMEYAVGVFNDVGDGATANNLDTDGRKGFAGRIFLYPFQKAGVEPLQFLGVGLGSSYGSPEGAGGLPSGRGFATEGQQQFFTYAPNIVADGEHWRISPQAWWYYGPFRAMAEYIVSSQELRRSDSGLHRTLQNTAWQVSAGYVLTGDSASPKGVVPRHPFRPLDNSWGALEVVARLSSLDVDNNAFPDFADPTTSASKANSWAAGLNWYLNKNIRLSMDYFQTRFDGGSQGAVSGQDENALMARMQLAF